MYVFITSTLAYPDDEQDTPEPTKKKKRKNGEGTTDATAPEVRTPRASRNVPET